VKIFVQIQKYQYYLMYIFTMFRNNGINAVTAVGRKDYATGYRLQRDIRSDAVFVTKELRILWLVLWQQLHFQLA